MLAAAAVVAVVGCSSSVPLTPAPPPQAKTDVPAPPDPAVVAPPVDAAAVLLRGKSRWVPVPWSELPGFEHDELFEAWNAWLKSCERPGPVFAPLCPELRRLSIGDASEQRAWLQSRLQPYRVETLDGGASSGLLTAYFEPELVARRLPGDGFDSPLYKLPVGIVAGQPWFSRREIDTLPNAQAALRGQALLYLVDPVDALLLQIQGSGRIRVTEPDGQTQLVRLAFAGHNGQPYQSVGRWLLERGELRDASWPGIRAWLAQHPQRVQELLWQNPRVVFFREEALSDFDAGFGPRGAQGVPLTPGRSIAVDPGSIPYGSPVWLASEGASVSLNRLVLAQDTGTAITGALRADYFVGWGAQAGELAGRLKQPLQLWVLWPKSAR
ncbi:MAG: MltA domain-containing protein [Rhodoferax sp.]|nr:MltA domain-containing protein [Rhodoferax sp.]